MNINFGEIETIFEASKNMTESVYIAALVNNRVEAVLGIKEISRITGLAPIEETDAGNSFGYCAVKGNNFEVMLSYDL